MVEWDEPWGIGENPTDWINCVCRLSDIDAIKYQKYLAQAKGHIYNNDLEALNDFMVTHYATHRIDND